MQRRLFLINVEFNEGEPELYAEIPDVFTHSALLNAALRGLVPFGRQTRGLRRIDAELSPTAGIGSGGSVDVDVAVIDEIQMLADRDRVDELGLGDPAKTLHELGPKQGHQNVTTPEQDGSDLEELGEDREGCHDGCHGRRSESADDRTRRRVGA